MNKVVYATGHFLNTIFNHFACKLLLFRYLFCLAR